MQDRTPRKNKTLSTGAAHLNARDAYKDIPILKRPTWGHEVAGYFFLGGISAGSALIGSLAEVFGGKRREGLARTAHYVSFATLLPCPPLLIDDLGYPARFHHMLRIFKPSSPMNLGSWALTTHGAGATLVVLNMLARDGKLPLLGGLFGLLPERLLAGLGLPSSLSLAGYTGVLLGTTAIPVWQHSQLLGGLFMASSISSGASAIGITSAVTGRETEEDRRAISTIGLMAGAADLALLGGYVATTGEAAGPLRKGETGMLVKLAALLLAVSTLLDGAGAMSRKGNRAVEIVAGVAGLAGGALLRWAVVHAGAASADDREGTLQAMKPRKESPGWGPPGL